MAASIPRAEADAQRALKEERLTDFARGEAKEAITAAKSAAAETEAITAARSAAAETENDPIGSPPTFGRMKSWVDDGESSSDK